MSLLKTGRPATAQRATSPDQGSALSSYPVRPDLLPTEESIAGRYFMRFARSPQDLEAVERLRFEVFNLELREGLDSAFETGRDHDEPRSLVSPPDDSVAGQWKSRRHLPAANVGDGRHGTRLLLGRRIRSLGASGRRSWRMRSKWEGLVSRRNTETAESSICCGGDWRST